MKAWCFQHGSDQPVIFRQNHESGRLGLSEFTHMTLTVFDELLDAGVSAI